MERWGILSSESTSSKSLPMSGKVPDHENQGLIFEIVMCFDNRKHEQQSCIRLLIVESKPCFDNMTGTNSNRSLAKWYRSGLIILVSRVRLPQEDKTVPGNKGADSRPYAPTEDQTSRMGEDAVPPCALNNRIGTNSNQANSYGKLRAHTPVNGFNSHR